MQKENIIKKIIKSIDKGCNELKCQDLGITIEEFAEIIHNIQENGLITKASVIRAGAGGQIKLIFLNSAEVTQKGLLYLDTNIAG